MNNIGLVLEGGGMRGAFTAGVLDFFMEKQIWLPDMYGVSAGACQACHYASNQRGRGLRVWTDYIRDKRYCSLYSLITTGDLFGAEMSYNLIPNHYDLYDYDEFDRRKSNFYAVVTNLNTGKAEYLRIEDMRKDLQTVRASCSLPLVSNIVRINGNPYLDGGMADSVPLRKSIEDGHEKNVVILTQAAGYRKSPDKAFRLIAMKYRKYPEFVKASARRYEIYNETMDFILEEEAAGRAFVIRPDKKPDIGRVEKNAGKIRDLHGKGYQAAGREYERLMKFLKE